MTDIRYCATGCKTAGKPRQIEAPAAICRSCEDNIRKWLASIPTNYALLPTFVEHGTTERNPDQGAVKRIHAPAPMRLEIIDLLDTRRGRKWLGTDVTSDRRGVVGTLLAWATEVIDGRELTIQPHHTVVSLCDFLCRHIPWVIEQGWASDMHAELKTLDRALKDAIGDYRPRPVGKCHVDTEDNVACGGPLLANNFGGVMCPRCGATWDASKLRVLGLALATQEPKT